MALQKPDTGSVGSSAYSIISQVSGNQVNPDNTTTPIETITFQENVYGVVATFNVLASTYAADGAPGLVSEKAAQIEQIAQDANVVGLRGAPDIDPATKRLYNYLVVTVGTPDFARTQEVWIRMDKIGLPSAFAQIAAAWALMQQLGPTGQLAV